MATNVNVLRLRTTVRILTCGQVSVKRSYDMYEPNTCNTCSLHEVEVTLSGLTDLLLGMHALQYNLNGSNLDGSFTMDDSNSFFSPYKILPIANENKYLGIFFSYFIMELYVVCIN